MKMNNKQRKLLLKVIKLARKNNEFNEDESAELDLLIDDIGKYVKKDGGSLSKDA